MLPVSAALRTAVCDPENDGMRALLSMAERDLVRVLRTLTPQDSHRVLEYLSLASSDTAGTQTCLQALSTLLGKRIELALGSDQETVAALRLYIEVIRKQEQVAGQVLRELSLAVIRFIRYRTTHTATEGRELIQLLKGDQLSELYRQFGGDAEYWIPLFHVSGNYIEALAHLVDEHCKATCSCPQATGDAPRHLRFGGLFLLLPLLNDLPLDQITRKWPDAENNSAKSLLRLVLIMKCFAGQRAAEIFFDPVVRDFLTISPQVTPTVVKRWCQQISSLKLDLSLQSLQNWQQQTRIVGSNTLLLAHVKSAENPIALLLDCAGGWLWLHSFQEEQYDDIAQKVSAFLHKNVTRLLIDPAFRVIADQLAPELKIFELDDDRLPLIIEQEKDVAETLARLGRLEEELSFLALPESFCDVKAADLALSSIAQGLLRVLARRLPGFSRSTLPYLFDNFLDFDASIETEEKQFLIRLGRPSLHIILNMTGLTRSQYRLSWLDERQIVLYQESRR